MRFSTIVPAVLAVAPAAVSALGDLGFAISAQTADGNCKSQQDYEADFDALKPYTSLVRGYDAADCDFAKNVLAAAKSKQFKVILGLWTDDDTKFSSGVKAIQDAASSYGDKLGDVLYAITSGSEGLYRKTLPADKLNDSISKLTKLFPGIKIGTADSYTSFVDGSADPVIRNPDTKILLVNGFPYWQGQRIDNATHSFFDDMALALGRIQSTAGSTDSIEFIVGETGWPSAGDDYQAAHVGLEEAKTYFKSAVCGLRQWGIKVFVFEAFDEPKKAQSKGLDGISRDETHWGVFDATRKAKFDPSC